MVLQREKMANAKQRMTAAALDDGQSLGSPIKQLFTGEGG
jgi:hypothetical protein